MLNIEQYYNLSSYLDYARTDVETMKHDPVAADGK
jgi:hypothetical protein